VVFWKRLISRRATIPILNLLGVLTPPAATGAAVTICFLAICFLGALPPVFYLADCFVRAILLKCLTLYKEL
jgi:hypothetical protein